MVNLYYSYCGDTLILPKCNYILLVILYLISEKGNSSSVVKAENTREHKLRKFKSLVTEIDLEFILKRKIKVALILKFWYILEIFPLFVYSLYYHWNRGNIINDLQFHLFTHRTKCDFLLKWLDKFSFSILSFIFNIICTTRDIVISS